MKKMLSTICVTVALVLSFCCFSGCGASQENGTNSDTEKTNQTDAKQEMKIEDITWTVDEGILDGERCVMLSFTNNSSFTVTNLELSFKEKANISEEKRNQYFEDIKEITDFDETDPDDVSDLEDLKKEKIAVTAESSVLCKPGESVNNQKCRYYTGYYTLENMEHFELVEPDMAKIKYVNDNMIITAYYDFHSKKFTKDSKTEPAFNWTDKEIGNDVPKPQADVVVVKSDYGTSYSFEILGWKIEDFNAYVNECKNSGFTVDEHEYSGYFSAKNENGCDISAHYDEDDFSVSVYLTKHEQKTETE